MISSFPYTSDGFEISRGAGAILQAYDEWKRGGPDLMQLLAVWFPELDEQSAHILDFAEEQALDRTSMLLQFLLKEKIPSDEEHVARGGATLPAVIAQLIESHALRKAEERERSLRLIGMPFPRYRRSRKTVRSGRFTAWASGLPV